jgi:4-amino-4-deoxy-L-arabinose transferase-like glycosyltransferase
LLGAFLLRLLLIQLDPYLHSWDEAYHALVAKSMMKHPLYPLLHANPYLDYNYKSWCCNHVWLHKQPVFMWQMALSMKVFGVNEFAIRFPSVIMGTVMTFFIYKINYYWSQNYRIAFASAFFFSLFHFQLELTTGAIAVDHNDVAFAFYVTASIWALTEYLKKESWIWVLIVGLFSGLAVLNKWLPGLLVFGGWGVAILIDYNKRQNLKYYLHGITGFLTACVVFLPWQFYIIWRFPLESQWEYDFNKKHFFEALEGHEHSFWYHFEMIDDIYSGEITYFLIIGLILSIFVGKYRERIFPFWGMAIVVYIFFSFAVTKMPAFTQPVSFFIFGMAAVPIQQICKVLEDKWGKRSTVLLFFPLVLWLSSSNLKIHEIIGSRSEENVYRNAELHNGTIFKKIGGQLKEINLVFNLNSFEEVKLMFYQEVEAYPWFPESRKIDSLYEIGVGIAVFPQHKGGGPLHHYMIHSEKVKVLSDTLIHLNQ